MTTTQTGWLTGVVGLDELLRGGFLLPASGNGLILLIRGQPGTGKTTLALQLAAGACDWRMDEARNIEFYSCEQDQRDIRALCDRLGFHHQDNNSQAAHIELKGSGRRYAEDGEAPIDAEYSPLDWLLGLAAELNESPEREHRRLVVVDGLNIVQPEERRFFEVDQLVRSLRQNARVGIIVYEPGDSRAGGIHSLADMIIELRGEEIEGPPRYYLNHLSIVKARFQQAVLAWHQYKIRDDTGLNVFPSLHFRAHRPNLLRDTFNASLAPFAERRIPEEEAEPHPEDGAALTHMIGHKNLRRGSCTVVLGPRRTWKTQLTSDFLRAGSRQGEPGLLISFLDNQGTIVGQRARLCERYCLRNVRIAGARGGQSKEADQRPNDVCWNTHEYVDCYHDFYMLYFRPGCLASGEFFHFLEKRLRQAETSERAVRRVVFWDLTQLESRFPLLANDRMFLPGLMDYLKHSKGPHGRRRGISSVFMGAPNTKLAWAAQAMADNVVFSWEDLREGSQGIAFYVDRIEGLPGGKKLWFLKESADQDTDVANLLVECKEKDQPEAESMIRAIRDLQGLPRPQSMFGREIVNE